MSRFRKNAWRRLLYGVLLLISVIVLVQFTGLKKFTSLPYLIAMVEEARLSGAAIGFFYIAYVIGVMVFPITVFPIVGGVLLDFPLALMLNILAATVGGFLSFCVSRYFGRAAVETLLRGKLKSMNQYATQKGFVTMLVLRLVGIPPFIITNYALGFSSMKKRHFILGTVFGILPWMVLVTYMSGQLWQTVLVGGEQGLAHALVVQLRPLGLMSVLTLALAGLGLWLKRRRAAS